MGSALMGSPQNNSMFVDRGTFWVAPLTYFIFPKVLGRTFFPNGSKLMTFAAATLVLTPFVRGRGVAPVRPAVKVGDGGDMERIKTIKQTIQHNSN